jgi:hypothetical protein
MVFCCGFSTERKNDEVWWKWISMMRRVMKIGDGEEDIVEGGEGRKKILIA